MVAEGAGPFRNWALHRPERPAYPARLMTRPVPTGFAGTCLEWKAVGAVLRSAVFMPRSLFRDFACLPLEARQIGEGHLTRPVGLLRLELRRFRLRSLIIASEAQHGPHCAADHWPGVGIVGIDRFKMVCRIEDDELNVIS